MLNNNDDCCDEVRSEALVYKFSKYSSILQKNLEDYNRLTRNINGEKINALIKKEFKIKDTNNSFGRVITRCNRLSKNVETMQKRST